MTAADPEYGHLVPLLTEYASLAPDDPRREAMRDELVTGYLPVAQHIALRFAVTPDAGTFQGDSAAIRAMLVNVLENSIDACRADGKPRHEVSLTVRRVDPWMIFDVRDNGIGMDRETRDKIFSLFFSSKGLKGTGLGLFISNKIVDKHGGDIKVESEPRRGSRFLIRLPLAARPSTRPGEE